MYFEQNSCETGYFVSIFCIKVFFFSFFFLLSKLAKEKMHTCYLKTKCHWHMVNVSY